MHYMLIFTFRMTLFWFVKDFLYKPSKLKLAPRFWSIGPPLNKFGSEHKNSN